MSIFQDSAKTVLVTGGAGFIGTHLLTQLLRYDIKVRVPIHAYPLRIDHPRIETVPADLRRSEDCIRVLQGVSYVVHAAGGAGAAGVSAKDAMSIITLNLVITANMLQAAWAAGVERLLLFSSSTGYPATDHPVKEDEMWTGPTHDTYFGYGWMKRYLERLGEYVAAKSDMKIAVVRPSAVYGPWDNFNPSTGHVIPSLIRRAVAKEDPFVVWGDGKEVRDFLHAADLARGALLMLDRYCVNDAVNIGYGKGVTIKEVVQIILDASGHRPAEVIFDRTKPSTLPFRAVDTSKSQEVLQFEPEISLTAGLRQTIEWYERTIHAQEGAHGKS